ncbi:MAG: hypothetical protein IKF13_07580 [Methanobrevibacter sp.]|uniref:hypothetical protein n=1 Tax=Methanobrevibacter sp. UBA212 TaxID=1915476 RepID=UPI0025E8960D|nr:hypothetical protein [Methanobrevibacter sp. UBA212]MBR3156660.1 hypothetical protein [Methanobrevibacter sp.]
MISKTQYETLKENYLSKNRSLHSLYVEINKEKTVPKQIFFKLINQIRQEEGLSEYYTKKEKRKSDIITHPDKSPNCYN